MVIAYRLSGEAKFPANIHDCHAAVRYLRANAEKYKVDPDRIGVVGGSAGGHLAGLLVTSSKVTSLHGEGGNPGYSSKVQCAVVMSAPMQIATGSVAERSLLADNPKPNAVWLFGGTVEEVLVPWKELWSRVLPRGKPDVSRAEDNINKIIISSNQSIIWDSLRSVKINDKIANYGKLFLN